MGKKFFFKREKSVNRLNVLLNEDFSAARVRLVRPSMRLNTGKDVLEY